MSYYEHVLQVLNAYVMYKERRRRAMDAARKQWSPDHDGYLDRTTTLSLRRLPHYTDRSNGNCVESSDAAPDSPLTTATLRGAPVTPAIPAHHHLYWQAAGATRHSNAASPTAID